MKQFTDRETNTQEAFLLIKKQRRNLLTHEETQDARNNETRSNLPNKKQ